VFPIECLNGADWLCLSKMCRRKSYMASGNRGGIRARLNYAALPSRNLEVTPFSE